VSCVGRTLYHIPVAVWIRAAGIFITNNKIGTSSKAKDSVPRASNMLGE